MLVFGDFVVERCGNADVYFIADVSMAKEVENNTWSLDGHGYICRNKNGKVERMHRVFVELAAGGALPNGATIDHINKCKTDNRLCNLRVVSQAENMKNISTRADNTTGYTGVVPAVGFLPINERHPLDAIARAAERKVLTMNKCPYCGSEDGVYTTYTGKQYYHWDGEPAGYNADVPDNQMVFARCVRCDRKISMRRILKEGAKK